MLHSQERLELAHAGPFKLGTMCVEPDVRLVRNGDTTSIVEPRVMQVLVALHQADGHILSRDDLVRLCWGGAVVGDNAVQRALSQARKIAATIGGNSFEIETIRGVGYRLVGRASCVAEAELNGAVQPPLESWGAVASIAGGQLRRRGAALAGIAAAAAALLLLIAIQSGGERRPTLAVSVAGSVANPAESAQWAERLSADLARLSRTGNGFSDLVEVPQHQGSRTGASAYVVQISTAQTGSNRTVDVGLLAPDDDSILWSGSFTGKSSEGAALREQVAVRVAHLLQCLLKGIEGGLNRSVAGIYTQACDIAHDEPGMARVVLLRRVMLHSPGFGAGWAELSIAEAQAAEFMISNFGNSADADALTRLARQHLDRAKRTVPAEPSTLIAEALLLELKSPTSWDSRLSLYDKAISLNPGAAAPYAFRSGILFDLGRSRDAIGDARRAVELDPLSLGHRFQLITLLFYQGLMRAGAAELAEAERLWPDSDAIRDAQFRYLLRFGDPAQAMAVLDAYALPGPARPVWEAYLRARDSWNADDIERAAGLSRSLYGRRPGWAPQHLQLLGHFNKVEEAYGLIFRDRALRTNFTRDPTIFFRSYMAPLRQDPRFIRLADGGGLVAAWQRSGRWPDFCMAPDLPYDCREVAAALQSRS